MKTLVYTKSGNFATILEDFTIAETLLPEIKSSNLTMYDIEQYFGKKFPELELVNVGFKVCNDNFRETLDLTPILNSDMSISQKLEHIHLNFVSVSKVKDALCDSFGKTCMYSSGYQFFKKITSIHDDIEKYAPVKKHEEEIKKMQEHISNLEKAINGAIKCRDLWGVSNNIEVDEAHKGEYLMLSAMEAEFNSLIKK